MRQRYYSPEIKRFINQDILTGSIGNSQSLNRYCYVQGNPVSYTDPFGLSPVGNTFGGFDLLHCLLGFLGMIPGPVGIGANLLDAFVFFAFDKDFTMTGLSLVSAFGMGAFSFGSWLDDLGKATKTSNTIRELGLCATRGTDMFMGLMAGQGLGSGMYQKYIVNKEGFTLATALEGAEAALIIAGLRSSVKGDIYTSNKKSSSGGGVEGGSKPNALRYNGDSTWTSNEGLIYGQGSIHGNRIRHVLDHTQPNPSKPTHTIFNVGNSEVIGLVDEAWVNRGNGMLQSNGNVLYDINMGRAIGTNGEDTIRIITKGYTNNVVTSFPVGKGVN